MNNRMLDITDVCYEEAESTDFCLTMNEGIDEEKIEEIIGKFRGKLAL
jgi:hypothetical protein